MSVRTSARPCAPRTVASGSFGRSRAAPKAQSCRQQRKYIPGYVQGLARVGVRGARRHSGVCRAKQETNAPLEAPSLNDTLDALKNTLDDTDSELPDDGAYGRKLPVRASSSPPPKPTTKPTKQTYVPPTLSEIAVEEGGILFKKTTRALSSLPLAIGELFVIAGLSAVGTVIEQEKSPLFYIQNYPDGSPIFGFVDYNFILTSGIDHIYSTWWFLSLLALLGASLAACSSTTQVPMVKVARKWEFLQRKAQFYKLEVAEEIDNAKMSDLATLLAKRGYQVFTKGEALYGFKGLVGRLAPIGVHLAILFILGGSAYSSLAINRGSTMTPQGADFDITSAMRKSPLGTRKDMEGSRLRINNFEIENYASGAVSQFYSDLSVMSADGEELYQKVVSVNDPLRWKGVTMYQTDWSLSSVVVNVKGGKFGDEGKNLQLPMAKLEEKAGVSGQIWGAFLPIGEETERSGISVLARDLNSAVFYKANGEFSGVRRPDSGKEIEVEGVTLTVVDIVGSTGLELKSDPGVPFIYAGYGGLIITSFMSFLSHSQVWALQEGGVLYVGGRSNRAKFGFDQEINNVLEEMPETN
eukprot:CAMPEP_0198213164 /NCGR_PEP_ID=MMETSP1445-20131203/28713_1 /TAXON_ID=36898 /ORGANISM="Pyramimonas sp., Strain CCMP2087" /LENGTH=582 /DNA_ID=CAMNT_0043887775 /DNA_START=261 /DNA_END=2009 /DNA_ORIENTATION=+